MSCQPVLNIHWRKCVLHTDVTHTWKGHMKVRASEKNIQTEGAMTKGCPHLGWFIFPNIKRMIFDSHLLPNSKLII